MNYLFDDGQDSVDYASSLFLDSLNNESPVSEVSTPVITATSSTSSSSHTSPEREQARPFVVAALRRSPSGEAWPAESRSPGGGDAEDSDTETDVLETVKPVSPDSREDESYRYHGAVFRDVSYGEELMDDRLQGFGS